MGFKDLFIVNDDKPKKVEPVKEVKKTQFPSSQQETPSEGLFKGVFNFGTSTSTPTFTSTLGVSQEHLAKSVEVYRNGFESLNQPGYDFYEFYQAILSTGVDNAQVYPMALMMAKSMDKTVSKEQLLQQSEFYIGEINKQYQNYVTSGNNKKSQLNADKNHENQSLSNELDLMNQQLEQLKIQIQDRQNKIKAIDGKYVPQLNEIDSKLGANEMAKNQLISSIEQVKNGIINNIKS